MPQHNNDADPTDTMIGKIGVGRITAYSDNRESLTTVAGITRSVQRRTTMLQHAGHIRAARALGHLVADLLQQRNGLLFG